MANNQLSQCNVLVIVLIINHNKKGTGYRYQLISNLILRLTPQKAILQNTNVKTGTSHIHSQIG